MKVRYKLVKNWKEIRELVAHVKATGYASFDFESSDEKFYDPNSFPTVIGIAFQPTSAWVIPLGHKESPFKNYEKILRYLGKEIFSNPDIVKIGHNLKYELKWLLRYNIKLRGRLLDTLLLKYILDEERPHDLKSIVARFMPEYQGYEYQVEMLSRKYGWANIFLKYLAPYNALDCILSFKLCLTFEPKVMRLGLYSLYRNMLMMLVRVLGESEYEGLLVDRDYLDQIIKDTEKEIDLLEKKMRSNKILRKYQKYSTRHKIAALIEETRQDIRRIQRKGKTLDGKEIKNPAMAIRNREEKISRYISGNLVSKKEKKLAEEVNFDSPKQLIDLLFTSRRGFRFKVVKYTMDKKTKRETDTPSTDEESLLALQKKDKSGFIDCMLKYRTTQKLYSTYMIGVRERLSKKNRVHAGFLIHGTVTGRLSSTGPNLQNIPRTTTSSIIKKMFIPPPGHLILELDYSQAELRIVAELANETQMIKWFNEGHNIHVAVACKVEGVDYEKVYPITKNPDHPDYLYWTKRKKRAKTINFGILYGQGPPKLAETLNFELAPGEEKTTVEEAKQFLEEWLQTFPRVKKWIKNQQKMAINKGYVTTLFGRKRRLPNIYSDNKGKRGEALRQSVNAPIQGSSSDYTLFSQIIIREMKQRAELPYYMPQPFTVHDNIGYYIKPEYIHKVVPILDEVCSNPQTQEYFGFQMKKVRMKMSFEVGTTWGTVEEYDPTADYTKLIKG